MQYDPKVIKQLEKLDMSIAKQLLDGIEEFATTPVLTKIKKLKTAFDGAYSLGIGDYRVVFYQENDLKLISRIAHRKEVYI